MEYVANIIVNKWKSYYQSQANEKIRQEQVNKEKEIYKRKVKENELINLAVYCTGFFIIFGTALIIKLYPYKEPVGNYQINRQLIASGLSEKKIKTAQYYCEYYYKYVKQGKIEKNPKYYALCHNLGVEE